LYDDEVIEARRIMREGGREGARQKHAWGEGGKLGNKEKHTG